MWVSPLTAAERDRAKKDARSDDANAFALQLLIQKAMDEDGRRLFGPGDAATLAQRGPRRRPQKLMLAVLSSEEEGEELDMKSA